MLIFGCRQSYNTLSDAEKIEYLALATSKDKHPMLIHVYIFILLSICIKYLFIVALKPLYYISSKSEI